MLARGEVVMVFVTASLVVRGVRFIVEEDGNDAVCSGGSDGRVCVDQARSERGRGGGGEGESAGRKLLKRACEEAACMRARGRERDDV